MHTNETCDTCRFYYAYGLTNGSCMHFLLSNKSLKDKDVKYTDTCDNWAQNEDRLEHQKIRYSYEVLKKEIALRNCKLK